MLSNRNIIATAKASAGVRPADAGGQRARLPADGLGRRLHLLDGPGLRGPASASPARRAPATMQHDLREIGPTYFFAPPRFFEAPADQRDDPHGGRRARSSGRCSATSWSWRAGSGRRSSTAGRSARLRPGALRARRAAGLRAAQERARAEPDPGRLHRRRGDRAGDLRVLPGARDQPQAALRPDRGQRLHHPAAGRRGARRHRRRAVARASSSGSPRAARSSTARPACSWSTSGTRRAPPRPRTPRAGWRPATPASSRPETGHLRIIDRAKDVGRMADGSLFAPKYVENKLKFYPNILEAVVFGSGRAMARAFAQHRPGRGRQLGRAQQHRLWQLPGAGGAPRGLCDDPGPRGGGEPQPRRRPDARGLPGPPVPDPAQGARRRRRRADPHPQGAPADHRGEVRRPDRARSTTARTDRHRDRGDLRGRPQGPDPRDARDPRRGGGRAEQRKAA